MHNDFLLADVDLYAHAAEAVDCRETVFAHQKAGDMGYAVCECAKHDGAVGNGFVAGHRDGAAQSGGWIDPHN